MPAEAAAGIIAQQQHDKHPQRVFLKIGCGYRQGAPAHPTPRSKYRHCERYGLWHAPGTFQRPERLYITVPADIIVITCAGESPAQVIRGQLMFGYSYGRKRVAEQ